MPVYNGAMFIATAIESVLRQSFTDLELIISDNASEDGTVAISEGYAATDPRVRLLRSPVNRGGNLNFSRVARAARGEYFTWVSANDLLAPDFIEQCVATLDARPDAVLTYGQTMIFCDDDPQAGEPYDDNMDLQDDDALTRYRRCMRQLRLNNLIHGLIRNSALAQTPLMPDYLNADGVLIARLSLAGKFVYTDRTRFYRRMNRFAATKLQSAEEVLRHHYPTERFAALFQNWQLEAGQIGALLRGGLPWRQLPGALHDIAQHLCWQAPHLAADVREAGDFLMRRSRRTVRLWTVAAGMRAMRWASTEKERPVHLKSLVPASVKDYLRSLHRDSEAWVQLGPLRENRGMTDAQVEVFCEKWGNSGFSADVDYCIQLLKLLGGGPVLECGTGMTTLLCASVGANAGFHTYSLEQDAKWSRSMRRSLQRTQTTAATVIDAPLKDFGGWYWYDAPESLPMHFSVIVCDGPFIDKKVGEPYFSTWRHGVLPWLKQSGRTYDVLLLDDLNDDRGVPAVERWQKEFGVKVERFRSAAGDCAAIRP
ncbi:MAG: glycosyltransferase family 2 protein [Proteobacteria bacterium]|nr:glycosyltransferase family 2 protein [Pseudomonadota bacterium]